jgi:hypothetical protein
MNGVNASPAGRSQAEMSDAIIFRELPAAGSVWMCELNVPVEVRGEAAEKLKAVGGIGAFLRF